MMTLKSLLIRFGLYFLGGMIIANIAANIFHFKSNNIDTILTMALLNYVVSKFIINNHRELTKQEYWEIFFGSLIISIAYNIIGVMILSLSLRININIIVIAFGLAILLGSLAVFLGLWLGQRTGRKAILSKRDKDTDF
jgi:hypothetical protein